MTDHQPGRFASIHGMNLDPDGGFVTFTAYEKLHASVTKLKAERNHCLRLLHRIADAYAGTLDATDCQRIAAQGIEGLRDLNR